MRKILIAVGTRPEVIKMAPVYVELARHDTPALIAVRQHTDMLHQALDAFGLKPDYVIDSISGDNLANKVAAYIDGMDEAIRKFAPDAVLVQGDTATCFASALAAFYSGIRIGHIEAGLRTYCMESPWPEEMHRICVDHMAEWCFAPTRLEKRNLEKEYVDRRRIHVVGNTVVDAIHGVMEHEREPIVLDGSGWTPTESKRLLLVTLHRRESIARGIREICLGIVEASKQVRDMDVVVQVHPNSNVAETITDVLGSRFRIALIPPQPYPVFVRLMQEAYVILSDSGGIQEECSVLGKPLIIARNVTERLQIVEHGGATMAAPSQEAITAAITRLFNDAKRRNDMARPRKLFGDGRAARLISDVLRRTV